MMTFQLVLPSVDPLVWPYAQPHCWHGTRKTLSPRFCALRQSHIRRRLTPQSVPYSHHEAGSRCQGLGPSKQVHGQSHKHKLAPSSAWPFEFKPFNPFETRQSSTSIKETTPTSEATDTPPPEQQQESIQQQTPRNAPEESQSTNALRTSEALLPPSNSSPQASCTSGTAPETASNQHNSANPFNPQQQTTSAPQPAHTSNVHNPTSAESSAQSQQQEAQPPPPQQHPIPQSSPTQQQLLTICEQLVELLYDGIASGSSKVSEQLLPLLDPDVLIKADGITSSTDMKGPGMLLAQLDAAHQEYPRAAHRLVLTACEADALVAYGLVEWQYQDVGGLLGHPATYRISRGHQIVKLQLSAGSGRIAALWIKHQLTEEDKEQVLLDPIHCYPAPFPADHLVGTDGLPLKDKRSGTWLAGHGQGAGVRRPRKLPPKRNGNGAPEQQQQQQVQQQGDSWGRSFATGGASQWSQDALAWVPGHLVQQHVVRWLTAASLPLEQQPPELEAVLDQHFRWHDAYGIFPSMHSHDRRHVSSPQALALLQQWHAQYALHATVVDVALAAGANAAFSSWQLEMWNRETEETCVVEGMEVDIFSPVSGQLLDSWVFRTAIDQEQKLLLQPQHRREQQQQQVQQQGGQGEVLAEEIGRLADRVDELSALVAAALTRRNVVSELVQQLQQQLGPGSGPTGTIDLGAAEAVGLGGTIDMGDVSQGVVGGQGQGEQQQEQQQEQPSKEG